jgi:hypothetical protein
MYSGPRPLRKQRFLHSPSFLSQLLKNYRDSISPSFLADLEARNIHRELIVSGSYTVYTVHIKSTFLS